MSAPGFPIVQAAVIIFPSPGSAAVGARLAETAEATGRGSPTPGPIPPDQQGPTRFSLRPAPIRLISMSRAPEVIGPPPDTWWIPCLAPRSIPQIHRTPPSTTRPPTCQIRFAPSALVEAGVVTAVSGPNTNTLLWNTPVVHDGALVLRSTAGVPNTAPSNGVNYSIGAVLGNATVVYNDMQSFAPRMTDQGLTNGTRYYYRVFNHDKYFIYSAGNVPSSSRVFS